MPDPNEWLTLQEAAQFAKVHWQTLRRMIKSGQLKAYKFGRTWRIKPADLEAALRPADSAEKESDGATSTL